MTVRDLENAVTGLSPEELQRFREWFIGFDDSLVLACDAWDRQIEEDIRSGKLDVLAESALQAHREGKTREL